MRVLVCGSRTFKNANQIFNALDQLNTEHGFEVLIHGAAPGADSIAEQWANARGLEINRFPAQWGTYGRGAGPIRNREMIEKGKPELVIAFFTNRKISRGTRNMVQQTLLYGVKTITFDEEMTK